MDIKHTYEDLRRVLFVYYCFNCYGGSNIPPIIAQPCYMCGGSGIMPYSTDILKRLLAIHESALETTERMRLFYEYYV